MVRVTRVLFVHTKYDYVNLLSLQTVKDAIILWYYHDPNTLNLFWEREFPLSIFIQLKKRFIARMLILNLLLKKWKTNFISSNFIPNDYIVFATSW